MIGSVDDPVTLAKYSSPYDAQLAKNSLENQGIRSLVADEATGSWLWHWGTALGGTKLLVAQRDAVRAQEILQCAWQRGDAPGQDAWKCHHCGAEVDAGFDVCWSCERPRDWHAIRDDATGSDNAGPVVIRAPDDRVTEDQLECAADSDAVRAFRLAVFGILIPPLWIYAAYLIVKCAGRELSPSAKRKYFAAVAICVVCATIYILVVARG